MDESVQRQIENWWSWALEGMTWTFAVDSADEDKNG